MNNINTNELIDEGLIIWFPGPQSYTGEDLAEFHVHGSRAVVAALQASISNIEDCRLAFVMSFITFEVSLPETLTTATPAMPGPDDKA